MLEVYQFPTVVGCGGYTTRKAVIYDDVSKTVLKDHLRIGGGGNFVIWGTNNVFYVAHSKAVRKNRLRM